MADLQVYPSGVTVKLNMDPRIHGMITCCAIRFDKVSYEVTYYIHGEQRCTWMHEKEFTTRSKKTQTIGFRR